MENSKKITLIQLISAQTMQNILPIIALKPKRVISIQSRGEIFQKSYNAIKNATEYYFSEHPELKENIELKRGKGFDELVETRQILHQQIIIDKDFADLSDMENALKKLGFNEDENVICNITGGTKLMSIGLTKYAEKEGFSIIYSDSNQLKEIKILSGNSENIPEISSYEDLKKELSITMILIGHGIQVTDRPEKKRIEELYKFANLMKEYYPQIKNQLKEEKEKKFFDKNNFHDNEIGRFSKVKIFESHKEKFKELLLSAVRANILEKKDNSYYLSKFGFQRKFTDFFGGGWFEYYVGEIVSQNSERFQDVKLNLEPINEGETDIVCMDGENLHLISCKLTTRKLLEHIESLATRARSFGGSFAKATICFFQTNENTSTLADIQTWCKKKNIDLCIGPDEIQEKLGKK